MRRPLFFDNDILPDEITSCNSEYVISTAVSSDDITTYFDTFVSNLISKEISKYNECDCIILPYSLDRDHYSGLLGIVVAIHLRLTPEWGFSRKPIIFIGPDPIEQVAKLSEYGEFLFTPWVFYSSLQTSDELDSLLCVIENKVGKNSEMPDDAYATFLKKMKITPPAMYGTRHSIANSWCRYHWFKMVGIEDKIPPNDRVLSNMLYFKYMKRVGTYRAQQVEEEKYAIAPINNENAKILLVDDEADKWNPFFKKILNKTDDEHFVSIGGEFNKYPIKDNLIDYVVGRVEDLNPDVVLLDLRLHEDDFEKIDKKILSGNIILNRIKNNINKGIQVIAFSASNKIWNYIPLSYDGIVIKESPEKGAIENYTEKCIDALISSIDRGIARGHWLKKVYVCIAKISDLISQSLLFQDKKDEILGNLNVAFDLLSKNNYEVNPKYLAYSYLQLYIVVEKFLQEDSIYHEIGREAVAFGRYIVARWASIDKLTICDYAINNGPKYRLGLNLHESRKNWWKDTHFKMSSVLLFGYGVRNTGNHPWYNIKDVRNNKAGHPETGDVTQRELETLLDFMIFIFDENNRQYVPMDYSLPRISSAIVTLVGKECQAKLNDTDANLPLQFDNKKPKLKIGDNIEVEVVVNKGKPIALHYITT